MKDLYEILTSSSIRTYVLRLQESLRNFMFIFDQLFGWIAAIRKFVRQLLLSSAGKIRTSKIG